MKLRNKMRRVCEEDDCYLDGYRPFKISHYQGNKYENLVIKIDHLIFKGNSFVWCKWYVNN